MNRSGLRQDAGFIEDTVSMEIASFLSRASFPDLRYSIEPMSRRRERWLGADARLSDYIEGFLPFYMQFKTPSAYPDNSSSRIIRDRRGILPSPLNTSPHTLFFSLRNKKPEHRDYQHNILYRLRQRLRRRGLGDAAYVCPLFLDRQAYIHHLHLSSLSHHYLPNIHGILLRSPLLIYSDINGASLHDVPLLKEHICIPPHQLVTSARHLSSTLPTSCFVTC